MSRSSFDNEYLSDIDRNAIRHYQQQWENATSQSEKQGWHNAAEEIRRRNGYSGGGWGNEYIPVDTYNPPSIPDIPDYNSRWDSQLGGIINDLNNIDPYYSPYQDRINNILDDLQNRPDYKSPYEQMIQEQLDKIMNRPDFAYDPENDAAYQAYKQRAYRLGDQAFDNMLGQYASNTGGRLNSWASSMSSEARNNYRLQAEMGVTQYEDRAFQKYQFEGANLYNQMSTLQNLESMEFNKYQASYNNQINLLGAIQNSDAQAYRQYRDQITDKRELANMVMQLDNQDFQKYAYMVDNTWKQFEAETVNYQNALQFKQNEWQQALDKTSMLGYVNNEASYILGVPTGTLSTEARQRVEKMEDFYNMQNYQLEQYKTSQTQSFQFEKELLSMRQSGEMSLMDYGYSREAEMWNTKINLSTSTGDSSNITSITNGGSSPLSKEHMKPSSGFGRRKAPTKGASTSHAGMDFPAPKGTPIYAYRDGVVVRSNNVDGLGNCVTIDHGNGFTTTYAHQSQRLVKVGDKVKKGTQIGKVGSTGVSTGDHLHFETRQNGKAVNPKNYL